MVLPQAGGRVGSRRLYTTKGRHASRATALSSFTTIAYTCTPCCTCGLAVTLVAACSVIVHVTAQTPDPFRQRVDYDIQVSLLPESHTLAATGAFTYHNHSPDPLDSLPVQLWANAYSTDDSQYAAQKRRFNSAEFAFAKPEDRGGYRQPIFTGDALASTKTISPELAWLYLVNPVRPGDSVTIAFSYELRVPKTFSRMGRDGQSHQITQWYPKVARYDDNGWHPMPYLDFGSITTTSATTASRSKSRVTVWLPQRGP